MKNINKSLIQLTSLMNSDKKFAFINISKSSIIRLNKKNEKSFLSNIAKEIINSINISGDRVMKNISYDLMKEIQHGKYSTIGLTKETYYHYPNVFEYFFENDKSVFDSIISFYIKNTPSAIISLHDQRRISTVLGLKKNIIEISYESMYNKYEEIFNQLKELNNKIQYCLLDCSSLGLALSHKIWNELNMSIIDLGKTLNFTKDSNQQPVSAIHVQSF